MIEFNIAEFLEVIPEIDWKRVFEDAEYAERCGDACLIFNEIPETFKYVKNQEVVYAYQRYCARAIYNGLSKWDLMTLNDFEREYNV